jgi:hypothetical protein
MLLGDDVDAYRFDGRPVGSGRRIGPIFFRRSTPAVADSKRIDRPDSGVLIARKGPLKLPAPNKAILNARSILPHVESPERPRFF